MERGQLCDVVRWGRQTGYEQYVKDGKAGSGKGKDTLDGFQSDEDFRWSNVLQVDFTPRVCFADAGQGHGAAGHHATLMMVPSMWHVICANNT